MIQTIIKKAKDKVKPIFDRYEDVKLFNQRKVLNAFQQARTGTHCFMDSTGYGYHDLGRETLEEIYTHIFQTEAALVRPQIVSGTHAIYLCLSILKPGDELLSLSGSPYDTLQHIIGTKGDSERSLIKKGIKYSEVPLDQDGLLDYHAIEQAIKPTTTMVMIQRSRGYLWRPSINIESIKRACEIVAKINPNCIIFVDNCYGEFVETLEPTEVGAHLMAGSLIKNPGGSLATSGGYVVGKEELVDSCADSLTAPGLGNKMGPTFGLIRPLMQGLFIAPHIVSEALFGAILAAEVFMELGFEVSPKPDEFRTDIIQAIRMGSKESLLAFCEGIQKASPVDFQYSPTPDAMPGYQDSVVMAGGTFIQGSSIELSADGPIREPYICFLQGGICKEHVEIALEFVLTELKNANLLPS